MDMYIEKKAFMMIVAMLLLVVFTVGCGGDKVAKKPVEQKQAEQTENTQAEKSKVMALDIPDTVTDEKEQWKVLADVAKEKSKPTSYMEEDESHAKSVKDVALKYLVLTYTVDYQTFSKDSANLYLSTAQTKSEKTQKEIEEYLNQIKDEQYVSELVSVKWGNMVFNNNKNKCLIFYFPQTKVTSATAEYLEKNKITKDKIYSTVGCLGMIKENGKWKIDIEDVMQIEEVAQKEAKEAAEK